MADVNDLVRRTGPRKSKAGATLTDGGMRIEGILGEMLRNDAAKSRFASGTKCQCDGRGLESLRSE
jgi:hypothetical protein